MKQYESLDSAGACQAARSNSLVNLSAASSSIKGLCAVCSIITPAARSGHC